MKNRLTMAWLLALTLASSQVLSQQVDENQPQSVNGAVAAAIGEPPNLNVMDFTATKLKLKETLGLEVSSISDSPIDGLLQVITDRGLFYTSKDGTYFMQARIFNLNENMRNETEQVMTSLRIDGVAKFDDKSIEFKAKNERYVVNVFTDISCGYCQKFHSSAMTTINNMENVNWVYRHFPIRGVSSPSAKLAFAAECIKQTGNEEAYWEFTDGAFNAARSDVTAYINGIATKHNLDKEKLNSCKNDEVTITTVMKSGETAQKSKMTGTPAIIIRNNETGDIETVPGAVDYPHLRNLISKMDKN